LRRCNFKMWVSATNFQAGQPQVIIDLIRLYGGLI
jgi:hypothetical protein